MSGTTTKRGLSAAAKRGIGIGAIALVVIGMILGTKVVSSDDEAAQGVQQFDPATYGAEQFPGVRDAVIEKAVDAKELSDAITADAAAAGEEFAVQSSGGPVYTVTVTGTVGEGASGIYTLTVPELPTELVVRVQTGPAINGTELRDATGEIQFGQFKNQIDFQNAAAALNEEMKKDVLEGIDTASLTGKEITVTGAFTLINPKSWLITPVAVDVE